MLLKKYVLLGLFILTPILNTAYGKVNPEHAQKLVGDYSPSIVSSRFLSVYLDNDQLFMESKGQGNFKLIHDQSNRFHFEGIPIKIKFLANEKDGFDAFIFTKRGRDRTFTKKSVLNSEYKKVAT